MTRKDWWRPEAHAERRPALLLRAKLLAAVRAFFAARGFVEVETPALQVSPGMEPHIAAIAAELTEPFGASQRRLYLHTSPEFAMKKLLAAGERRIFQLAHCWRDGERTAIHHPEFTMLEWYRTEEGTETLMADCAALLAAAGWAADAHTMKRGEALCDPFAAPERISVAEAFARFAGIDLLATLGDREALAKAARGIGLLVGERDSWDDIFHRVMLEKIESKLGLGVPAILHDYPLALAVNARPNPCDARLAERFELYVCGVELANGCAELIDAAEQRRRFQADAALKEKLYGARVPADEEFLEALTVLPPCAGIALGFDRLAMLLAGVERIDDVLWAPVTG